MPALPIRTYSEIFDVLQDLPIFYENGRLKKEKDDVWNTALFNLQPMKKHNLYIYVQKNRNHIQVNLKKKQCIPIHDIVSVNEGDVSDSEQQHDNKNQFDTLKNLLLLQYSASFNAVIRKICSRPFYIIYSLPEQLDLWSDLRRKNLGSTIFLMMIDGLIENVKIGKTTSESVLLYALATKVENNTILLYQSISEEKTVGFFNFFLREFLRDDFDVPSELVIGYSYGLLDAASKVFNECSFNQYKLYCYEYLTNIVASPPDIIIHVDTMDLLKTVDGWDCLDNQWKKKFYLCCIIFLRSLTIMESFKETVIQIFVLCQTPYENEMTKIYREKLLKNIQTSHVKVFYEKYLEYVSSANTSKIFSCTLLEGASSTIHNDNILENAVYKYIKNLKSESLKISPTGTKRGIDINSYYCTNLIEKLIDLLLDFPVWTDLISRHNTSETVTVNSFSYLSLLNKNLGDQKKEASDFIKSHWQVIKASCQEGRLFLSTHLSRENRIRKSSKHKYLKFEENWMGKNQVAMEILNVSVENNSNLNTEEIDTSIEINSNVNTVVKIDDVSIESGSKLNSTVEIDMSIDINSNTNNILEACDLFIKGNDSASVKELKEMDDLSVKNDDSVNNEFFIQTDNSLNSLNLLIISIDNTEPKDCTRFLKEMDDLSVKNDDSVNNEFFIQTDNSFINSIDKTEPKDCIIIEPLSTEKKEAVTKANIEQGSKQNMHNKRSRKYCDAFPAATMFYGESNKKIKKQPVIRNGTSLRPNMINKEKYVTRNTSVFDAIAEIFVFANINFSSCREKFNEIAKLTVDETNFINVIVKFSSSRFIQSDFQNLYKSRSKILLKHGHNRIDEIFCNDKIGNFLTKITENTFSFKETTHCKICASITNIIETKILISTDATQFQIRKLSEEVTAYFDKRNYICLDCVEESDVTREFGPFLIIDVENINSSDFIQAIPIEINIFNQKFSLIGVIDAVTKQVANETQYVAYCRSLTNRWSEHNDIKKHVKLIRKLPKINFAMLIYVHI